MKRLVFTGHMFSPTGVAIHHRNFIKALIKEGVQVQVLDPYKKSFDPDNFFADNAYKPISIDDDDVVTLHGYNPGPNWGIGKKRWGFPVHEGNVLLPGWAEGINHTCERIFVPSRATKILFSSNGVNVPIVVCPEGYDPAIYNPEKDAEPFKIPDEYNDYFVFGTVGAWDGMLSDRKGITDLITAYSQEFKKDEKVLLFIKCWCPWGLRQDRQSSIKQLPLPIDRAQFIVDDTPYRDDIIPKIFKRFDVAIFPTRGEAWGLPILESMQCGVPVMVPRNKEAGYMDFVPEDAYWVKTGEMMPCDPAFFHPDNKMPMVDIADLRAQMRKALTAGKDQNKQLGLVLWDKSRKWTWQNAAREFIKYLGDDDGTSKDSMGN